MLKEIFDVSFTFIGNYENLTVFETSNTILVTNYYK